MTHAQAVRTSAAERYLLDEMAELERYAFEEHYFSCRECAEDVRVGGLMQDGVKARLVDWKAGRPSEAPAKAGAARWGASTILPWAAAASLALFVGYQSTTGPTFNQAIALSPVTLRPASRGAEPVVTVEPGASAVTLAVDFSVREPGELDFDLRSQDNRTVSAGRVRPSDAAGPLLLFVPASLLRGGERYVLTVRQASSGDVAGEFRFVVAK